jgi:hypothetical protein
MGPLQASGASEVIPGVLVIECDIPDGVTLSEWRRTRIPSRGRPALVRLVRRLRSTKRTRIAS